MTFKVFQPAFGYGQTISATSTASNIQIGNWSNQLVLSNLGTIVAYVRSGGSDVVASATDYPILPGQQVSISKIQGATHISAVTASGSTSIHAIPGEGL